MNGKKLSKFKFHFPALLGFTYFCDVCILVCVGAEVVFIFLSFKGGLVDSHGIVRVIHIQFRGCVEIYHRCIFVPVWDGILVHESICQLCPDERAPFLWPLHSF